MAVTTIEKINLTLMNQWILKEPGTQISFKNEQIYYRPLQKRIIIDI